MSVLESDWQSATEHPQRDLEKPPNRVRLGNDFETYSVATPTEFAVPEGCESVGEG